MERTYTLKIDYPDGSGATDENVYKFESEWYIDHDQQIIIACHSRGTPKHFPIVSGMTITVTEENVEMP